MQESGTADAKIRSCLLLVAWWLVFAALAHCAATLGAAIRGQNAAGSFIKSETKARPTGPP